MACDKCKYYSEMAKVETLCSDCCSQVKNQYELLLSQISELRLFIKTTQIVSQQMYEALEFSSQFMDQEYLMVSEAMKSHRNLHLKFNSINTH